MYSNDSGVYYYAFEVTESNSANKMLVACILLM